MRMCFGFPLISRPLSLAGIIGSNPLLPQTLHFFVCLAQTTGSRYTQDLPLSHFVTPQDYSRVAGYSEVMLGVRNEYLFKFHQVLSLLES